ncbi:MAG: FG-GAP-like repeat-containing protein [Planctomycetota bacterium]|nr:FG-GAP-like repeat-containing protein [Planctomycetota bacterium]
MSDIVFIAREHSMPPIVTTRRPLHPCLSRILGLSLLCGLFLTTGFGCDRSPTPPSPTKGGGPGAGVPTGAGGNPGTGPAVNVGGPTIKLPGEEREEVVPAKYWTLAADTPEPLRDFPVFSAVDQRGEAFGEPQLRGKVWVASLMFLHETDASRLQSRWLNEFLKQTRLWPDRERLLFASFAMEPTATASQVGEFAQRHKVDPNLWKLLTATDLAEVSQKGFGFPREVAGDPVAGDIPNSSLLLLIDGEFRVRGQYDSREKKDIGTLVHDLRGILAERVPGLTGPIHVAAPYDLFYTPWLDERREEQLETAPRLPMSHDFTFTDRRLESGITFVSHGVDDVRRDWRMNHYDHGNGVAAADVDGDGLVDLYFVSQAKGNELWRNLGNGRFENITKSAGVGLEERVGVSASFADVDNDGDYDLYVTTTRHGNALFENDGTGKFRDITRDAGLEYVGHSSTVEFFDYDRDGLLDLYLVNVGKFTTDRIGYSGDREKKENPYYVGDSDTFAAHLFPERNEPSILYHNEGGNRFRNVSEEMGIVDIGWSSDATPYDADEDGWIDLYVLNMQGVDELWRNVEGKKFERHGPALFAKTTFGSMGVKAFDYNNDGHVDLYMTNMHADMWNRKVSGPKEKIRPLIHTMPAAYVKNLDKKTIVLGNVFYKNSGKESFREVAESLNTETYWPWGPSTGDLNADGWQDLFITACMNLQYRYHPNNVLLNDQGKAFYDAEFILGVEPRRDGQVATPWYELDCDGLDATNQVCRGRTGKVVMPSARGRRSSSISTTMVTWISSPMTSTAHPWC